MVLDSPLAGVGTGNYYSAVADIDRFGVISGAHNELTRAGAEHGFPGLLVWACAMLSLGLRCVRTPDRTERGLAIALAAAGVLSMLYNGSKLVMQPVLLCLALSIAEKAGTAAPLSRRRRWSEGAPRG
jgi:O-antigen ligase